jgi:chromatin segregation and condensation protein Rec8/ScpA/Scc1 (kleisin family)
MDDANHSSPQADFRLISQSFRTAAGEIEKIQNLPAITGGDRILAEIRQMRQEAKEQTTRLEERITAVTTRLEERVTAVTTHLEERITAVTTRLEERITTSHQSLLTLMSTKYASLLIFEILSC